MLGHDLVGFRVVFEPLAHFFAVFGQDEAVDDNMVEGRFVKQGRGDHHQGVEPAPGLVESLGNEIGREGV